MTRTTPSLANKAGTEIRKGRVSPALRSAITLIVHEGLSHEDAAQRVGMARESLSKALQKPHVRAVQADVKQAWVSSAASKAWRVVSELMTGAQSEKVKLEAARTVLQAAGELSPEHGDVEAKAQVLIQFIRNGIPSDDYVIEQANGVTTVRNEEPGETAAPFARHEIN